MKGEAQKKIDQINASIPKKFKTNLEEVKVNKEREERARHTINKLGDSSKEIAAKRFLKKMIDEGKFEEKQETINGKKAKKINKYLDQKIESEMKAGNLKKADMDEYRNFQRKHGLL